jgi:hypothetical protein
MPSQRANRTQKVQVGNKTPSLSAIQLPEPALEEERVYTIELPISPQTTQDEHECSPEGLFTHRTSQLPELALVEKEEQTKSIKSFSCSSGTSHEPPSCASNQLPEPALEEEHKGIAFSPKHVFIPPRPQSSFNKERMKKRGQARIPRVYRMSPSAKSRGFLLILTLSIFGVAQAKTDCRIMSDWLPDMFNGTGTACCDQTFTKCARNSVTKCGITCVDGRITQM